MSRDRVAAAIDAGAFDAKLIGEVSKAVASVDSRTAWEFAPGRTARHALCLSPEDNAEVRPAALRWLAAAPPVDATWEYHAARQPSPTLRRLEIGGKRVDLDETRAVRRGTNPTAESTCGSGTRRSTGAPRGLPEQVSFLFLDNLLGEDEVERWIGRIDVADAPTGGRTPAELKAEVERRAAGPAGETWVLGQRAGSRGQVETVMADAALKRTDLPFADQHVAIRIGIEGWRHAGRRAHGDTQRRGGTGSLACSVTRRPSPAARPRPASA